MGLIILLVVISLVLAGLYLVSDTAISYLRGRCWRCNGTGKIVVRGERVPLDELTDREYGEYLVEGIRFYRAVHETCPRCKGTGRKNV